MIDNGYNGEIYSKRLQYLPFRNCHKVKYPVACCGVFDFATVPYYKQKATITAPQPQ